MGLKGAASYFQHMLATVVLAGLINVICELYIDDIIIWGQTEQEFKERVDLVLERLAKFNITLNPDKVYLGFEQLEVVGYLIDKHGLTFTRDRVDKVLQIEAPVFGKQLKQFVGVANYFHDHIRDYSIIMQPLNHLLKGYEANKAKRISWTQESLTAFERIRGD
jgi:hypothetical protein